MHADTLLERNVDALARLGFSRLGGRRDPVCFASFYRDIPFRYPALFEALCLSFSWAEAIVGEVQFAPNPVGSDLHGLAASIRYDVGLWEYLAPRGYLIVGRMSGGRYDPCAFDMNRRRRQDAPLVRVDHEQILSFQRLGQPSPLAPSFGALLRGTLAETGAA